MEGMWLGANAPARIGRLVLANTACHFPDPRLWNEGIAAIRASGGLDGLAGRIVTLWFSQLWFSQDFRTRAPALVAPMAAMLADTPAQGYIGCCAAIRDMDHRDLLRRIGAPTLIIAGRLDQATPLDAAQFIHSRIAGAELTVLEAAHISNVEEPRAFADAVLGFLTRA
jgi:3-oxoadipate enol-lactonase